MNAPEDGDVAGSARVFILVLYRRLCKRASACTYPIHSASSARGPPQLQPPCKQHFSRRLAQAHLALALLQKRFTARVVFISACQVRWRSRSCLCFFRRRPPLIPNAFVQPPVAFSAINVSTRSCFEGQRWGGSQVDCQVSSSVHHPAGWLERIPAGALHGVLRIMAKPSASRVFATLLQTIMHGAVSCHQPLLQTLLSCYCAASARGPECELGTRGTVGPARREVWRKTSGAYTSLL
jgi:hypothetical protein